MKKNTILFGFYGIFLMIAFVLAKGLHWKDYQENPKVESYVREVAIKSTELNDPAPDTEYFYRFEGIKTTTAGEFPWLTTITKEDSLGIHQRKKY